MRRRRSALFLFVSVLLVFTLPTFAKPAKKDARLKNAFRAPERNGWTLVHLEGTPAEIGFQHGYLLAEEIADALQVTQLEQEHDTQRQWQFFRDAAKSMMWPKIEHEYREELQGIVDGATARGAKFDLWDIVALNAALEWDYYVKELDKKQGRTETSKLGLPERCSAFVATGSYTKDGKVVIAHNNWSSYLDGTRWTILFEIVPAKGNRILMDGMPGLIHSGDDFGVTSAGIAITETTISQFAGYDDNGIPEFVRARKAMQYANSIDDFAAIMKEGNNGGYANDWLIADIKNNEIAHLELGLKNVTLERTQDGVFVGSNFPKNQKLIAEETKFDPSDMGKSANARHARWDQLMSEYKGKIDLQAAQKFMGDHYDTYEKKEQAGERSLCGHIDLSPRGSEPWQPPYGTAGAVQNKAADAAMIQRMALTASAGHSCGIDFKAAEHVKAHPEFSWEKDLLRDMKSSAWTEFQAKK